MLYRLLKQLVKLLFSATCILCDARTNGGKDICQECANDLPCLHQPCPCCALPLSDYASVDQLLCGQCLRYAPSYDTTLALWPYQPPVTRLISALKFKRQLKYANLLGQLLAEYLCQCHLQGYCLPEVIIPVPLHVARLRARGFNQSLEIARPIAKALHIAIDVDSCQRIRATLAQSSLPAKQRKRNMRNAFAIVKAIAVKHVAIIDDVVTTGHTVNELSKQLRKAGVQRIDIWCCARAIR